MSFRKIRRGMAAVLAAALLLQNTLPLSPAASGEAVLAADVSERASGVNVAYRTQEEIRNYVKASGAKTADAVAYQTVPLTEPPYAAGRLSDATLNSALKMLNQIRYIAGIADDVVLDESYNTMAQAASLVNYVNDEMTHYPKQPAGMPADLYNTGKMGAASSNIAWGSGTSWKLNYFIALGWMNDGDAYNIDRLGHRRWLLNPSMKKTGFGLVNGPKGTHSAVYVFDSSGGASEYGVMWPAQNMPVEYFGSQFPWSVSMNASVNIADVQVTLTRSSDGRQWRFSQASADGAFYVNNDGYGQKGCIIFRPEGTDGYRAGDSYRVSITTGLSTGDVSYTVNFFELEGADGSKPEVKPSGGDRPDDSRPGGDTGGGTGGGDTSGGGGAASGDGTSGGDTSGGGTGDGSGDGSLTTVRQTEVQPDGTRVETTIRLYADGSGVITVVTTKGDETKYGEVFVNTADLASGKGLKLMKLNPETDAYILCDNKSYTISDTGEMSLPAGLDGAYALLNAKNAKAAVDEILKTVKAKKASRTLKPGKTVKFAMSSKLDMNNVSKITYTVSNKSVATVSKNGRIRAIKKGTATVKARVTLKNGRKKTVKMKIKVK